MRECVCVYVCDSARFSCSLFCGNCFVVFDANGSRFFPPLTEAVPFACIRVYRNFT